MIQSLLLAILIILCILLIISIFRKPFDEIQKNPCRFKIMLPKYSISDDKSKRQVSFNIVVEKRHRYFINFPLLFKFYSNKEFKTFVKIHYTVPGDKKQKLLEKDIDFTTKTKEHIVYITDVIMGKILIEIDLEVDMGNPIIEFEIMENSTCDLTKEHRLELKWPD
jgi:hypothetical protein